MRILFLLSFISLCHWAFSQDPIIGLTEYTDQASSGYTFFCPDTNNCYLVDECGLLVNQWDRASVPGLSARMLDNGLMLRTKKVFGTSFFQASTGGIIELVDWDNTTVGSYQISNQRVIQHHDAMMLPNGNIILLVWKKFSNDELDEMGAETNDLWSELVYEIALTDESKYEIVWEWNLKNHLIQDEDTQLDNYAVVEDNIGKVDINYRGPTSWGDPDRWHCNAIDFNPQLDQILINSRNNSEVWIIDHSTTMEEAAGDTGGNFGKGGQLLYRWGNPQAYGRGNSSDLKMYGSHGNYWIPEGMPNAGKIMFFNNGDERPEGYYSTIEMIDPNILPSGEYETNDNLEYYPLESELVYKANDPFDFRSTYLSNAHQMANGNVFINEGSDSRFFEVNTQDNSIVWEYISPDYGGGFLPQGVSTNNESTFRAYKYESTFPGFEGRDLTGTVPLESNPGPSICGAFSVNLEVVNYPCYDSESGSVIVRIVSGDPDFSISLIDQNNVEIVTMVINNTGEFTFNDLLLGSYVIKVEDAEGDLFEENFEITAPEAFELDAEFLEVAELYYCQDDPEPNYKFSVSGNFPPYKYYLNDSSGTSILEGWVDSGEIEEIFIPLNTLFELEIEDRNFCIVTEQILIENDNVVEELLIEVEANHPSSASANDGRIVAHVTGGIKPYSYEWFNGAGQIVEDSIYANLEIGDYFVEVTDAEGCEESTLIALFTSTSTTIVPLDFEFTLSPNPCADKLQIQISDKPSIELINLKIIDTQGRMVVNTNLLESRTEIAVNHLTIGIYLALFSIDGKQEIQRFVKL